MQCINHPDRKAKSRGLCGSCYDKELKLANPEYRKRQLANTIRWYQRNPELAKERERSRNRVLTNEQRETCRKKERERHLRRHYNLSIEEYESLKLSGCSICGSKDRLHADHDHKSGKFRAILCGKCNQGLGLFDDDISKIEKAADYLRKHNSTE